MDSAEQKRASPGHSCRSPTHNLPLPGSGEGQGSAYIAEARRHRRRTLWRSGGVPRVTTTSVGFKRMLMNNLPTPRGVGSRKEVLVSVGE
ncbi:hypothetical protein E2C01_093189 [Portunus trituberculatus]|uniref:Uncharacterized protein n=1 Tax=Portunus trituberculatus TaxID=210409 RepID=A0A5B7JP51_PORTR|nr:hypothetical protein [Portunus trituberculatus]